MKYTKINDKVLHNELLGVWKLPNGFHLCRRVDGEWESCYLWDEARFHSEGLELVDSIEDLLDGYVLEVWVNGYPHRFSDKDWHKMRNLKYRYDLDRRCLTTLYGAIETPNNVDGGYFLKPVAEVRGVLPDGKLDLRVL